MAGKMVGEVLCRNEGTLRAMVISLLKDTPGLRWRAAAILYRCAGPNVRGVLRIVMASLALAAACAGCSDKKEDGAKATAASRDAIAVSLVTADRKPVQR